MTTTARRAGSTATAGRTAQTTPAHKEHLRVASARTIRRKILSYIILVIVTLFFVAPILYMVIGSFKPADEVLNGLAGFLPSGNMSFDNYAGVIGRFDSAESGYFANFYLTSAIVSAAIVLGGLVINSMAAYALARLRWRGRNAVLSLVIILVILPFEAIAVPLFYMLNDFRNTYLVQFLPFVASAFSIFLFYTFFIGLPREIQESARLDGAGPFRVFWQVIVPMSKPVFASVTILSFLAAWSSFLFPVMMIDQPSVRPLPLAIAVFKSQPPIDWGQIFAFGVLLVIPVVVVFLMFQRFFIQSVASSAVKG